MAATEYIVFIGQPEYEESPAWKRVTVVQATSPGRAVRAALEQIEDADGRSFVAVPARSWKPVLVRKVEQTRLEELE